MAQEISSGSAECRLKVASQQQLKMTSDKYHLAIDKFHLAVWVSSLA